MDLTSLRSSSVSLILCLMNFLASFSFFFVSTNYFMFCSISLSSAFVKFNSILRTTFLDYVFGCFLISVVFFAVYYNDFISISNLSGTAFSLVASTMAKLLVSIGISGLVFESFSWFSAVCVVWLLVVLFFEPNIASPTLIRKDPINFSYYYAFI